MGVLQSTTLNRDQENIRTSAEFGDPGDGSSKWFHWTRSAAGSDPSTGAPSDSAVTDPSASGSVIALLKGALTFLRVSALGILKAEDSAAVSGDSGVMALAVRRDSPTSDAAAGDYHALHVDALGRLRTLTTELGDATNATVVALDDAIIVKASAGKLWGIQGHNTSTAQYIQIHDAASVPSNGAVPVVVLLAAEDGNFSIDFGRKGRSFATGIVICNSSTAATKTVGGADCWFDAQYE